MTSLVTGEQRKVVDDLERQVAHWLAAARTFLDAEEFASQPAWNSVEDQVGLPLRRHLGQAVNELVSTGRSTVEVIKAARTQSSGLPAAQRAVQAFRRRYTQVEVTLDFFGDAVNSRTSPSLRSALQQLDQLAVASMSPVLAAAGQPTPRVLSYIDKGMGASILRAGVRLWAPGTVNPVAAIKIVRHNLYRPTSLFHETGHQVAHLTGWTQSLGRSLSTLLADDPQLRSMWIPWASEISADVHAFVHTGFASVSALYDVVGDAATILRWPIGDPHPIGWLRTLLGCAFCRTAYGAGIWDSFEAAVIAAHPLADTVVENRSLLERSRLRMPEIAAACLATPIPGLAGRPVTAVLDPARVSPGALSDLERAAGPALWTSPAWRRNEGIRIVALAGLREAERPDHASAWIDRARDWLTANRAVA